MVRLVAAATVLAALTVPAASVAAAPACPALRYIALVQQADAALQASPPRPAAGATAVRDDLAAQPAAAPVLQPILDDLEAVPPDVDDARMRLAALSALLRVPPRSTCAVLSAPALGALRSVYASPAFAHLDQQQSKSILEQIGAALGSLVSDISSALGRGGSIALGAVVALLIAGFVAWRVRAGLARRPASLPAEPAEAGTDPGKEWDAALIAAQQGAYREAVRRAFRSALLDVVLRGHTRIDAAWTTRELLTAVRGDAALLAALAAAAASFDTAWYSGRTVSPSDWEIGRQRCERVRALAHHRVAEPVT